MKTGVCYTCRFYSNACKLGVSDKERGRGAAPCGWWKRKRKKKVVSE
jgi:hypothetical protein